MRERIGGTKGHITYNFLSSAHDSTQVAFETVQNDAPVIAKARTIRDAIAAAKKPSKDFQSIGLVPMALYHKLGMEKWGDADWRKFFNDPANRALLTAPPGTF